MSTTSRSRSVENPLIRVQISQIHLEPGWKPPLDDNDSFNNSNRNSLQYIYIYIPKTFTDIELALSICDGGESIKPCLQDKPTIRAKNHERKRDKRVVVYEARKDSIQSTVTSRRRIVTILISAFIIVSLGWWIMEEIPPTIVRPNQVKLSFGE